MSLKDRIPEETKNRAKKTLLEMRARAVELQEIANELDGLIGIFLEGVASRAINMIDIALGEL